LKSYLKFDLVDVNVCIYVHLACYSSKELCHNPNPIALGSRWLAYADKKVGPCKAIHSDYVNVFSDFLYHFSHFVLAISLYLCFVVVHLNASNCYRNFITLCYPVFGDISEPYNNY